MENILKSLLVVLYTVFAPVVPLLLFIGLVVGIDTVFGIVAAKKNGKAIKSNKLARVLTKSLVYISLVGIFFGMDYILINHIVMHYFPLEYTFTKIIGLGIVGVETFSIDEKIRMINDGKGIRYYFKKLLARLKEVLGSIKDVKDDIDEIKN